MLNFGKKIYFVHYLKQNLIHFEIKSSLQILNPYKLFKKLNERDYFEEEFFYCE